MYKPNLIPFASTYLAMLPGKMLRVFIGICSISLMLVSTYAISALNLEQASPDNTNSTIANDFNLPVTAASKHQSLDGKKKTSIFIDNVVIRQGSLEILADRVEANATAGKGQEVITATGKPASYQQRLEDGTTITASANEIVYTVVEQTISLKGAAEIKQNDVQVKGDSIAFDMANEQIMASSNANSSESVTTVLSPGAFSSKNDANEDEDGNKD